MLNDEDFAEGDDIFKIWPTSGDRDAFRATMTNGQTTEGFENSKVVQAHVFFSLQIKEWLHTADEDQRLLKVRALKTALMGLLELVVIDLKTKDDWLCDALGAQLKFAEEERRRLVQSVLFLMGGVIMINKLCLVDWKFICQTF